MQIELREELTQVTKIAAVSNEIFGEVEILRGKTNHFLAKRLNDDTFRQFQHLYQTREFLFDNSCPFLQEFYCQTDLFGERYILFQYYDYSLRDLLKTNTTHRVILPESSLVKLFFGVSEVLNLFRDHNTYYPMVSQKTVYCSPNGQVKVLHPILFESFFRNVEVITDPCVLLYIFDQCFGQLAAVVLEHASLTTIGTPGNQPLPDKVREALFIVKKRYAFNFLNLLRKFDYNVLPVSANESTLTNLNTAQNYFNTNQTGVQKFLIGMKSYLPPPTEPFSARASLQSKVQNQVNDSNVSENQRRFYIFENNQKDLHQNSLFKRSIPQVRREPYTGVPENQTSIFKKRLDNDIPVQYNYINAEQTIFNDTPIHQNLYSNNFYTSSSNNLRPENTGLIDANRQNQTLIGQYDADNNAKFPIRHTIKSTASDYFANQIHMPQGSTYKFTDDKVGQGSQSDVFNPTDFFTVNSNQRVPQPQTMIREEEEQQSNKEVSENSFFKDIYVSGPKDNGPDYSGRLLISNAPYKSKIVQPVPVPDYIMQINENTELQGTPDRQSLYEIRASNYSQIAPKIEVSFKKMLGDVYAREYHINNQQPKTIKSQIDEILKNETLVNSIEINREPNRFTYTEEKRPTTLHDFPENLTVTYYSPYQ